MSSATAPRRLGCANDLRAPMQRLFALRGANSVERNEAGDLEATAS